MNEKSIPIISDWRLASIFALALVILLTADVGTYRLTTGFMSLSEERHHAHRVLEHTQLLLAELVNAETGQRGYLITGNPSYLEPYNAALPRVNEAVAQLVDLTKDDPEQTRQMEELRRLIATKLGELRETIDLRREQGFAAAQQMVETNLGKGTMDAIRRLASEMTTRAEEIVNQRYEVGEIEARRSTRALLGANFLSYALLLAVFVLLNREIRERRRAEGHIARLNANLTRELAELARGSDAMSHDVRVAIRHINGFASILLEDFEPLEPAARECLDVIRNSAAKAAEALAVRSQL